MNLFDLQLKDKENCCKKPIRWTEELRDYSSTTSHSAALFLYIRALLSETFNCLHAAEEITEWENETCFSLQKDKIVPHSVAEIQLVSETNQRGIKLNLIQGKLLFILQIH